MDDLIKKIKEYVNDENLIYYIKNNYQVQKNQDRFVESIGYKGKIEMIKASDALGICCGCHEYFHVAYNQCERCGENQCYNDDHDECSQDVIYFDENGNEHTGHYLDVLSGKIKECTICGDYYNCSICFCLSSMK